MDITSAIIGLVSLAIFVVPIVLLQRKQKQQKQSHLQYLLDAAQQEQLKIAQYDLWNHHFAIGMDKEQNVLFYQKKRTEGEEKVLIRLAEVAACSVNNMHRQVDGNRVIDLIELRFTFHGAKHREQALEFYNKEESLSLSDELLLAEKWNAIVGAHLQNQQPLQNNTAYKSGSAALV